MNLFMSNLGEVVNSNLMNLKDVDMVFFPIMQDSHYYLICYNLKTMAADIIDSQNADGELKSKYKSIPERLHQLFMAYLKNVGHASWKGLTKMTPTVLEMHWRTMKSGVDCGIFLNASHGVFHGRSRWEMGVCHFSKQFSEENTGGHSKKEVHNKDVAVATQLAP